MEGPLNPDNNPLFSNPANIPKDYWQRLKYDFYKIIFLGYETEVFRSERLIKIPSFPYRLNFQIYLIILKYLSVIDEREIYLTNNWVLAKDLEGGLHFFDKSHPLNVREIFERYGNIDDIKKACQIFSGVPIFLGDFAYDFFVFPEVKIRYIFYEGDEDFSPQITVNFQKGLDGYFNLDVIWAMVNVITKGLIEKK
ncbi:MAG: DUF3786 domain-containing protein [Proteobacteria bacterium]|nr:DUF3786 domain-containing protein [Pseudomonadota bacterium]